MFGNQAKNLNEKKTVKPGALDLSSLNTLLILLFF
jgi:hypothetical protein